MNNHAHFLIHSEKSEYLGKYMQRLNTSYSQYYNKALKRVGYVFRNRYYSQDILNEKQLYNCLAYIHNNPVKAKIVKEANEYKYSSYNEFMGEYQIITETSIKLLFGGAKNYVDFFKNLHNRINEDGFIEVKEKEFTEFVKEIEQKNNKRIKEIIKNKEIMKKIILEARKQTNVTLKELAELFDVSKSTIANYEKFEK